MLGYWREGCVCACPEHLGLWGESQVAGFCVGGCIPGNWVLEGGLCTCMCPGRLGLGGGSVCVRVCVLQACVLCVCVCMRVLDAWVWGIGYPKYLGSGCVIGGGEVP